jgi:hypothetical protein
MRSAPMIILRIAAMLSHVEHATPATNFAVEDGATPAMLARQI